MRKSVNIVLRIIITIVLIITLFSAIQHEKSFTQIQPLALPQPNQLSPLVAIPNMILSVIDTADEFDNYNNSNLFEEEHIDFHKRKQIIDNFCQIKKRDHSIPFGFDPKHLFVLQDRGVAWCPVFKAGTTTMLSTLVDLSSKTKVIQH